jgi:hypothetical protein
LSAGFVAFFKKRPEKIFIYLFGKKEGSEDFAELPGN